MKRILALLLTITMVLFTVGCSETAAVESEPTSVSEAVTSTPAEEEAEEEVEEEEPSATTEVTDRAGNPIEIKEEYTKIVSYAPSLTEKLIDLGFADKIVAITNFDMAQGLSEDVMRFDMMSPEMEAIVALEPDLILATNITAAGGSDPFTVLRDSGTTIATFPTANSIAEINEDIAFLGTLLNAEDEAAAMNSSLNTAIEEFRAKSAEITEKKTVYMEISPAPDMYSTGSGTFLNEMIEIVGGVNVLADQESWIAVSEEQLLSANPDVIFTNVNYLDAPIDEILARNGWDVVTAVANGEVYAVDNNATSLPNHNIVKGLQEMAVQMYPEIYAE